MADYDDDGFEDFDMSPKNDTKQQDISLPNDPATNKRDSVKGKIFQ